MTEEVEFSLLNLDKSVKGDELPIEAIPNAADGVLFRI